VVARRASTKQGTAAVSTRDVVLTKKVWERIQKITIVKQLPNLFEAKRKKGVGTPFPSRFRPITPLSNTETSTKY